MEIEILSLSWDVFFYGFPYQHHKLNYISEINYVLKLGSSPQLPSAAAAHYTLTVLLTALNSHVCDSSTAGVYASSAEEYK